MTSLVKSVVVLFPPMSGVLTLLSWRVFVIDLEILLAKLERPKYLNIITELNKIEVGLAIFFPAMFIPE